MDVSDKQLASSLTLTALSGIPLLSPGDNLVSIILQSLKQSNLSLKSGDILVIAQKVVSKAEGRYARLADINPSERAFKLAEITGKDPRLVELILSESREIVRHSKGTIQSSGVVVAENHHGVVLANAGIDSSNVGSESEDEKVLLLPVDPDKSAETINKELQLKYKVRLAVIINDSLGRAWRNGTTGTAIGVSGIPALLDLRGRLDLFKKPLRVSEEAIADELSSAASLLQGQADEGRPIVLIRGYDFSAFKGDSGISGLIRPKEKDLFR